MGKRENDRVTCTCIRVLLHTVGGCCVKVTQVKFSKLKTMSNDREINETMIPVFVPTTS